MSPYAWDAVDKLNAVIARTRFILGDDIPITIVSHSQGTIITLAALQDGARVTNWILMGSPLDKESISVAENNTHLGRAAANVSNLVLNLWSPEDGIAGLKGGIGSFGLPRKADGSLNIPNYTSNNINEVRIENIDHDYWWLGEWIAISEDFLRSMFSSDEQLFLPWPEAHGMFDQLLNLLPLNGTSEPCFAILQAYAVWDPRVRDIELQPCACATAPKGCLVINNVYVFGTAQPTGETVNLPFYDNGNFDLHVFSLMSEGQLFYLIYYPELEQVPDSLSALLAFPEDEKGAYIPGYSPSLIRYTKIANAFENGDHAINIPGLDDMFAHVELTTVSCPFVRDYSGDNAAYDITILGGHVDISTDLLASFQSGNFETCVLFDDGLPPAFVTASLRTIPGGDRKLYIVNYIEGLAGNFIDGTSITFTGRGDARIILNYHWMSGDFVEFETGKYRREMPDGVEFILETYETRSLLYQEDSPETGIWIVGDFGINLMAQHS
jgi:hypothetical protein